MNLESIRRRRHGMTAALSGPLLPRGVLPFPLAMLVLWAACLLLIPSQLVIGPIGAPGRPADLIGLGLLVWWLLTTVSGRNRIRGVTFARVAVALFVFAVMIAFVNGNAFGWYAPLTVRQETDDLVTLMSPDLAETAATLVSAADRGLIAFGAWLGVLLVAAESMRGWRDLEVVTGALVALGSVVGAIAVLEFSTGIPIGAQIAVPGLTANSDFEGILSRSVVNRVSATAVHPIELGVVLACLFPLALHRMLFRRRLVDALMTGLIAVGALTTVSRSAIVCLGVAGFVLWLGWPRRWKLRALVVVPFAALAVRSAVPGLLGTLRSLFVDAPDDPSVTGRTSDYGVILDLYAHNPIAGRGLFTFVPRYFRIVDNQWLMVLVELGLLGLVAVLVLYAAALLSARHGALRAPDSERAHLSRALAASGAAFVLGMGTFDAWTFPMAAGIGFCGIGLCLSIREQVRGEGSQPAQPGPADVPRTEPDAPLARATGTGPGR